MGTYYMDGPLGRRRKVQRSASNLNVRLVVAVQSSASVQVGDRLWTHVVESSDDLVAHDARAIGKDGLGNSEVD